MRDPRRCLHCGGPNPPPDRKHGKAIRVYCGNPCRLKHQKRQYTAPLSGKKGR